MKQRKISIGHPVALITGCVWATTFISTKTLLLSFTPIEILFTRFILGFLALWVVHPHRLKKVPLKHEVLFMGAGLCGVTLYYLMENVALTFTLASNVSVILSIAPFFTAVLAYFIMKSEEKFHANFFIGFVVAMAGIILISYNGTQLQLNPRGDLLAIGAAFIWACYSIIMKRISSYGYPLIPATRRIFFYGILFMIPTLFFFDFSFKPESLQMPINIANFLYLGLGASATCFVTWNFAVKTLGAVKSSVYIYVGPVVTVITSAILLHEPITLLSGIGTVLTLCGLLLSESRNLRTAIGKNRDTG